MPFDNEAIAGLHDALRLSPDNLPLRQALGDALMGMGRYDEAEAEYRKAISLSPDNEKLKLSLAKAFFQQGKSSHAVVVLEELLRKPDPLPAAMVLHSRLLSRNGEIDRATRQYKRAIEIDPSQVDDDLAARLGLGKQETEDLRANIADQRVRAAYEDPTLPSTRDLEKPKTTFSDVGGMDAVKQDIRIKIIHPLEYASIYAAYGKKAGGGILMYGPPGCGKTHLARATAGEIRANFIPVGISDVLDMWIGSSERNLRGLFEQARRNRPCVLFFDEVDALAASRSDMRASAGRHLINQFLAEMDGIGNNNEGVLILAATNAPWHVDPAFRRPGRFDRIIFVPPPDAGARAAILRIHLRDKPLGEIDHELIASKTDGFSGADLRAVVETAVEEKLLDAVARGVPSPITTEDLLKAAEKLKPSTLEWFASARNYATYSNQGGAYDDVLKFLKRP
jgi:transitional endoplasmic reticulum ATPase